MCGAISIGVTTFVVSNMFLKSKSNSTNQAKEKTVATANDNDKEKAKLEEEKQKTENEKTKAENEKLKQENENLKKENKEKTITPAMFKGIESTVTGYVESFAEDVNVGYIRDAFYYDEDGPLYDKQSKVIPNLYKQRINEYVQNVKIDNITRVSGNTFRVKTTETITINKPDSTVTNNYHNTYIVKAYEGLGFKMYDIL